LENGFDVALAENHELFTIHFDGVAAGVFAEYDYVTHFHIDRTHVAIVEYAAGTYGDHFTLVWLFLGGTGQHYATCGFLLFFLATNYNTIV